MSLPDRHRYKYPTNSLLVYVLKAKKSSEKGGGCFNPTRLSMLKHGPSCRQNLPLLQEYALIKCETFCKGVIVDGKK